MSIEHFRRSRTFRFAAFILIFDFIFFQTGSFAETQIQLNQETGNFQPVKPVEELDRESSKPVQDELPNPMDFWNESPLSPATPEIQADETLVEVPDSSLRGSGSSNAEAISLPSFPHALGGNPESGSPIKTFGDDISEGVYDFEFYSFEDALELIRPEFAAAIPIVGFVSDGLKIEIGAYGF